MRLGMGIALIYMGAGTLMVETPAPVTVAQNVIAAVVGVFLIAGLWTPIMGGLAALDQVWIALSVSSHPIHIFLAVLSISLAMLGPGIWSIDALLFGRRRFPSHRQRGRSF
jgi:putative oxidoreductase